MACTKETSSGARAFRKELGVFEVAGDTRVATTAAVMKAMTSEGERRDFFLLICVIIM